MQKDTVNRICHDYNSHVLLLFLFVLFVACSPFEDVFADDKPMDRNYPFYPGERLIFGLRWGIIPAGEAVLEVLPVENIQGVDAYHFVLTARTNAFVDVFYKVRDRIDAYVDLSMTHSVFYKKSQREGTTEKDIVVTFDWEEKKAQYSNFGKKIKPVSLLPGSFDPLSIFYFLRFSGVKVNTEIEHAVTDGKKNLMGKARTVKRESIEVPAGTFDTYLLEPDLKDIGGVFRKSKDAKLKIWVTADNRHLLVRLRSKVIVGSFTAELVTIEGLNL